jgi:hypothetical protein
MHEESIIHRVLVMGAIALAVLSGANAMAKYEPPPPPPISTVTVSTEQHSEQAAEPASLHSGSEPSAGAAPGSKYYVKAIGPGFMHAFNVTIPNHLAGSIYMGGTRLVPAGSAEPGMLISYQATPEAPQILVNANAEHFRSQLSDWLKTPLDFGTRTVDRIEISPVPTLNPALAPKAPETKEHAPEAPSESHILDEFASSLSIAATAGEIIRKRLKSKPEEASSPSVNQVRRDHDTVSWTPANGARQTVVTREDVERLDDPDKRLIAALCASIRKHFDAWAAAYPDRDASADAAAKAGDLQHSLCADLTKLRGYIQKTGRQLTGFEAIEVVCQG